ncbi:MAG TPA: exodeoxyribonuclease VII large subunit [Alphaproteobacteria bacterium]|nr:exodeoxyribonuclease VII large subunit [Alphaproteobacteria bacterium]
MPKASAQPPSQMNLLDQPRPGSNMPEFSVSEISRLLKKTVEETFGMVRVRAEVGECKYHSNGHIYITLKDEGAVLAAVVWRGQAGKLGLRPEIGMEVVCQGRLTTYAGQSKYQLVIERMALAGMGALLKLLEDRKQKLAAEGLFDEARKQLLPYLPDIIGVVTSPTGAVIRDILHRLADRFPRRVLLWPVAVQGEGAAAQIAAAIEGFNALHEEGPVPRPDLLIVARGGGSVEDLMPFNEESVVRAAAASLIPLISAVGHETDTTLIDYAADVRAPTPTAAAEMAVPVRVNLLAQIMDDGRRLWDCLRRAVSERHERLTLLSRALGEPSRAIEPLLQRLDEKSERLAVAVDNYMERRKGRFAEAAGQLRHPRDLLALTAQRLQNGAHRMQSGFRELYLRKEHRLAALGPALEHLSPKAVLGRGYALVQSDEGRVIAGRTQSKKGQHVRIEFHDGARGAVMED